MMEISDQESIKRMFTSISTRRGGTVSESTRETFLIYIKRFCEYAGKTPDELIKERVKHWKSDDIFVKRKHEELLMKFAQYLRKEGYSTNTVSTAVGAVRSLYRSNYFPMIEVNIPAGRPVREYKVPTREELASAVDLATVPWHKAFMLVSKDCGISLQDVLALNDESGSQIFGTVKKQVKDGQVPIHLHIVREKTLMAYDTFLGEDSYEALNNYKLPDEKIFPYSTTAIQMAMQRIGKKLEWKRFTPYSLRKWFRTRLTLEKVNEALIEYMMGHSLGKIKAAYFIPPPQELKKIYKENYHALSLNSLQ